MCVFSVLDHSSVIIIDMNPLRALSFLVLLSLAQPVVAQVSPNAGSFIGVQTRLAAEPFFPEPGEIVTVSLEHLKQGFDTNITWQLDGVEIADAKNKTEVEVQAGKLGEESEIVAMVARGSSRVDSYRLALRPIYIDLVLEPQTRVPNFYSGRALPSIGSRINVTALVNDGRLRSEDLLTYTWTLAGKTLEGGPIRGSNRVSFDTPRGSEALLFVTVRDASGAMIARRGIYFDSVRPELLFYESNALHGVSHTAIADKLQLIGNSATVVAEPYNLDIRTYNNPDVKEWKINRVVQNNTSNNPYVITVQKATEAGQSSVSFHVRSTTEFLQGAEDRFRVTF